MAVRNIDIYGPLTLDGITLAMNGAADGYFVEGSDFSLFDATEQTSMNSPNCAWDKDNGGSIKALTSLVWFRRFSLASLIVS